MLGEDHSLLHEFPEHRETIFALAEESADFKTMMDEYNAIDAEIRELELKNAPIGDDEMHLKKHHRSELKDKLYRAIQYR